jgi:SH3-like domain-containing protein
MSKKALLSALAAATLAGGLALGWSGPVSAQYCEGTVHGLSSYYNLATGSGFLAVRKRPTASSRMIGQLFNRDRVEILDRSGNWYKVWTGQVEGWSHRKWMWNSCGY